MYNLRKSTLNYKNGNTKVYQFKNEFKETDIITLNKFKSGYEVEVRQCNGIFKRTCGLPTIKKVQNWLNENFN